MKINMFQLGQLAAALSPVTAQTLGQKIMNTLISSALTHSSNDKLLRKEPFYPGSSFLP